MRTSWPTVLVLLAAIASPTHAQPVTTATLRFGAGAERLGIDAGSRDPMRPLFFGIDAHGDLHLPDFEKTRIAVFSLAGAYLREIRRVEGVTPRMNFFDVAPDGAYVSFSDGTLFHGDTAGQVLWRAPFPIGVIPSAVLCTEADTFFVVSSGATARCYAVASTPPFAARESVATGNAYPLVTVGSTAFTLRLADMPAGAGRFPAATVDAYGEAALIAAFASGASAWRFKNAVLLMDAAGSVLRSIPLDDLSSDPDGWNTVRAVELPDRYLVAVLSMTDDALVIRSVTIPR